MFEFPDESSSEWYILKVVVIGTGYVGLVTGACLADVGNEVWCVDKDVEKLSLMNEGNTPFYEPQLDEIIARNLRKGTLFFTEDLEGAMRGATICIIAVGTPSDERGAADVRFVEAAAWEIGTCMNEYKLIVTKSTVPVGMSERIRATVSSALEVRKRKIVFDVVSNPEFLREGGAVRDFTAPDRVLLGVDTDRAERLMRELYSFVPAERVLCMDVLSSEMSKYAANAMLATRISFMNEMAGVCERVGADIEMVRAAIGADARIGREFLSAGCGFGGSCFPKDLRALIDFASKAGAGCRVIEAVQEVNEEQKKLPFAKLVSHFGSEKAISGKNIAVWGLTFKPGTSDVREAPSLVLIEMLLSCGAFVRAHDPKGVPECVLALGERRGLTYAATPLDALEGADALLLLTEWEDYRSVDIGRIRQRMHEPVVVDGRNFFSPRTMKEAGFIYYSVGRP